MHCSEDTARRTGLGVVGDGRWRPGYFKTLFSMDDRAVEELSKSSRWIVRYAQDAEKTPLGMKALIGRQ